MDRFKTLEKNIKIIFLNKNQFVLKKKHKLSLLFCLVIISNGLLGEIAHDHSHEIHDVEYHEFEFHNDCVACSIDQTITDVEFISYHPLFSDNIEIEQISFYQKKNQSYFLSRAPPQ